MPMIDLYSWRQKMLTKRQDFNSSFADRHDWPFVHGNIERLLKDKLLIQELNLDC